MANIPSLHPNCTQHCEGTNGTSGCNCTQQFLVRSPHGHNARYSPGYLRDDGVASGDANDPTVSAIKRCRALAIGRVMADHAPVVGIDGAALADASVASAENAIIRVSARVVIAACPHRRGKPRVGLHLDVRDTAHKAHGLRRDEADLSFRASQRGCPFRPRSSSRTADQRLMRAT
jgi:hypothetical protein